jgi:mono/diheme cytochrome c family protein
MKHSTTLFISTVITGLLVSGIGVADETRIIWEQSDTAQLVQARCSICHSLDYIQMNAGFLKKANWETEVAKMRKTFGAPVSDDEAKQIIAYLTQKFGVPE